MGRIIEISKKSNSLAGRRNVKFVLHEIYDNDTQYNKNGISWQQPYVEQNAYSVKGMPLVTQFLDDDFTMPMGGHGEVNTVDGEVTFKNSIVVGSFENAYVDEVEVNSKKIKALIGDAYIYEQRFPELCKFLEEQVNDDKVVESSVEICAKKSEDAKEIEYDGGYKAKGRIPKSYEYSGHAILVGEIPADDSAVMLELNSYVQKEKNEGEKKVSEFMIKGLKIELNELNYDDITSIIIRAFNKLMGVTNSYYYDEGYWLHKLYPTRAIMHKYNEPGVYYQVPYTLNNTSVDLGDITKVTEDWTPTNETQIEINTSHLQDVFSIKNNKKGGNEMDEKDKKIEELNSKVNDLTKKVEELNSAIVEANKTLEAKNTESTKVAEELNSLRQFKQEKEVEAKKVDVEKYFETEVKKNGFTDVELNSLKAEYVDKVDLDGLKRAEADLCVKKVKELNNVNSASTETNSVNDDIFMSIHNAEKSDEDYSDIF